MTVSGCTILHCAAAVGSMDCARYIIGVARSSSTSRVTGVRTTTGSGGACALLAQAASNGDTAVIIAARGGFPGLIEYLCTVLCETTTANSAIGGGSKSGGGSGSGSADSTSASSASSASTIHPSIQYVRGEAARSLALAAVNQANNDGWTPIHAAVAGGEWPSNSISEIPSTYPW